MDLRITGENDEKGLNDLTERIGKEISPEPIS
jgi:hypothetical protein